MTSFRADLGLCVFRDDQKNVVKKSIVQMFIQLLSVCESENTHTHTAGVSIAGKWRESRISCPVQTVCDAIHSSMEMEILPRALPIVQKTHECYRIMNAWVFNVNQLCCIFKKPCI